MTHFIAYIDRDRLGSVLYPVTRVETFATEREARAREIELARARVLTWYGVSRATTTPMGE